MKPALPVAVIALAACGGSPSPTGFTDGGADIDAIAGMTYSWDFAEAALPPSFYSVLGEWQVGDGAIAQTGAFNDPDFPRIVIEDLQFTDLHLSVRCRPEAGSTDRACGLLFRAEDSENYYITRANALENNVRLYHVIDGDRVQFASADRSIATSEWHTLEVDAVGTQLTITWDGEQVISETDATFARGAIGLWTKADSVTRFDDLVATAR